MSSDDEAGSSTDAPTAADTAQPDAVPGPGSVLGAEVSSGAYRDLLSNRPFRNLLFANLTSSLGDWIGFFAILALTQGVLGGDREAAFGVAGVLVARVLPALLLGTAAGVLTDRWDRKKVMIWTDIGRGLVMIGLAFAADLFYLFVLTFVIEMMSALFIPAKDATVPSLLKREHLVRGNQLSLVATYATLPVGSMLFALTAGIATWVTGGEGFLGERPAALAIWLNAGTFFVSAWFITRIDVPTKRRARASVPSERDASAVDEFKEGFRFIGTHPMVRALIGGVTAAFLAAGAVIAVGPFFADRVNAGDAGFGILGTVVGLGLLAGILSVARIGQRIPNERLFAPAVGIAGAGLIATAFMPRLELVILPAMIMGAGAGVAFVTGYTLLQLHTDEELRGRTFAAFNAGVRLALFASMIVGPTLMGTIGLEPMGPDGTFPYAIGGARITLMAGGGVAIIGAVFTGRSVFRALTSGGARVAGLVPRGLRHGYFVVFEGGEGAGKSTQIRLLRTALERAGYDVVETREPGGTDVAEEVRALLLDPTREIDPRSEVLLYAAARADHVSAVIGPALEKGQVVICDRYIDSSVAYQGAGRGLGEEWVAQVSEWASDSVLPDLTVLLDVDAQLGLERVGSDVDRLEAEGLEFHQVVNEAFRARARAQPDRYLVLDASLPVEAISKLVRAQVLDAVDEHTATLDAIPSLVEVETA